MRVKGSIIEIDPIQAQNAINVTCLGAFLVSQEASKRMLKRKRGSIFFTGATAGVKGFANSSVFAMGKFALRGLAQSLARELHPQNIHHLTIRMQHTDRLDPLISNIQKLGRYPFFHIIG